VRQNFKKEVEQEENKSCSANKKSRRKINEATGEGGYKRVLRTGNRDDNVTRRGEREK